MCFSVHFQLWAFAVIDTLSPCKRHGRLLTRPAATRVAFWVARSCAPGWRACPGGCSSSSQACSATPRQSACGESRETHVPLAQNRVVGRLVFFGGGAESLVDMFLCFFLDRVIGRLLFRVSGDGFKGKPTENQPFGGSLGLFFLETDRKPNPCGGRGGAQQKHGYESN